MKWRASYPRWGRGKRGDSLYYVKPDDGWNGEPAIQGEVRERRGDSLYYVKPDDGWNVEPVIQGEVEREEGILSTMLNQMMDEMERQLSKER